ncbi:hypothetical protein LY76DRAFT_275835 [Colletotrichum caudatum]|nr:hypothetical protein LY76DRAFT_275835 [Colletotrichum caudatum]
MTENGTHVMTMRRLPAGARLQTARYKTSRTGYVSVFSAFEETGGLDGLASLDKPKSRQLFLIVSPVTLSGGGAFGEEPCCLHFDGELELMTVKQACPYGLLKVCHHFSRDYLARPKFASRECFRIRALTRIKALGVARGHGALSILLKKKSGSVTLLALMIIGCEGNELGIHERTWTDIRRRRQSQYECTSLGRGI